MSEWQPAEPARVVAAACRHKSGFILVSARHWDELMHRQREALAGDLALPWRDEDQGFIDQYGRFMSRETAWIVAKHEQQIRREVSTPGRLFSENLY